MTEQAGVIGEVWHGSGAGRRGWRRFQWSTLLWSLVFPARIQRIEPTLPGVLLIALSLGVGLAAYNTANNILFIALSLLLSCLILSGLLSWLNFSGLCWRLTAGPALRAGHDAGVILELRNAKKLLPTYGVWFDVRAKQKPPETALPKSVRKILAASERAEARDRIFLGERLDPGDAARLDWVFRPARRGVLRLELTGVGSLFPFGFLRKSLGSDLRREVTVWPAPVEYRRLGGVAARWSQAGRRLARAGSGADLLALRRYEAGDSHRLIHWKASARLQRLMVRQFAAESAESFSLWLQTSPETWPQADRFELLVSFAATLAEDLFRAGKLAGAAINDEPPQPMRGVRDMEAFLDKLAVVERIAAPEPGREIFVARKNVITFAPDGARGVAAYVDGAKAAAA